MLRKWYTVPLFLWYDEYEFIKEQRKIVDGVNYWFYTDGGLDNEIV